MKKRLISLLLALILVFSVLPATVFAEEAVEQVYLVIYRNGQEESNKVSTNYLTSAAIDTPISTITADIDLDTYYTPADGADGYTWNSTFYGDGWNSVADRTVNDLTNILVVVYDLYTVTFDSNGGSDVEAKKVAYNSVAEEPEAPTKEGYTFDGWYLGEDSYDFTTPVTGPITLTAQWTEARPEQPDKPDGRPDDRPDGKPGDGKPDDGHRHVHDFVLVNAKKPTLLLPGYTGDWVCKYCGKVKSKGEIIPPLGAAVPSSTLKKPTTPMSFTDVSKSDWFYDAVKYAYDNGLMVGVSSTSFAPYATLDRATVVTVLYRIEGEPYTRYNGRFNDVSDHQWYTDAVEWAATKGIVTGYSNGNFGPEDPVTREQLAAILYRYALYRGSNVKNTTYLNSYTDGDSVSEYAVPPVRWAVSAGVLLSSNGQLRPQAAAIRAEVAVAMSSFYEGYVK